MPAEVRDRAESVDRYLYFVMYALTAGFVAFLMLRNGVPAPSVGLQLEHWRSNVAIGTSAGALLVLLQSLIVRFLPEGAQPKTTDRFQRRSVGLWVFVFFVGTFAEEFWIAFCLVAMRTAGYSAVMSIAATAVVFGAVHLAYGFGGALAVALKGAISALLFLWCGSLIPMFLFHFIGNLGNLYWLRRSV
jgi:membrane protease YdiL (CAAX protease family)